MLLSGTSGMSLQPSKQAGLQVEKHCIRLTHVVMIYGFADNGTLRDEMNGACFSREGHKVPLIVTSCLNEVEGRGESQALCYISYQYAL